MLIHKHINRCTFSGILDSDAFDNGEGAPVVFNLRCDRRYRVGSSWRTQSERIPFLWWGHEAHATSHKLTKGLCVFVEGQYESNQETKFAFIRVTSATLLGAQYDSDEQGAEDHA